MTKKKKENSKKNWWSREIVMVVTVREVFWFAMLFSFVYTISGDATRSALDTFDNVYHRWEVRNTVRKAIEVKNDSSISEIRKSELIERYKEQAHRKNSVVSVSDQYPSDAIDELDIEYLEDH